MTLAQAYVSLPPHLRSAVHRPGRFDGLSLDQFLPNWEMNFMGVQKSFGGWSDLGIKTSDGLARARAEDALVFWGDGGEHGREMWTKEALEMGAHRPVLLDVFGVLISNVRHHAHLPLAYLNGMNDPEVFKKAIETTLDEHGFRLSLREKVGIA